MNNKPALPEAGSGQTSHIFSALTVILNGQLMPYLAFLLICVIQ